MNMLYEGDTVRLVGHFQTSNIERTLVRKS